MTVRLRRSDVCKEFGIWGTSSRAEPSSMMAMRQTSAVWLVGSARLETGRGPRSESNLNAILRSAKGEGRRAPSSKASWSTRGRPEPSLTKRVVDSERSAAAVIGLLTRSKPGRYPP